MDKTELKSTWTDLKAWLWTVPGTLWDNFLASTLKTKAVFGVIVAIAGLWGFDKLPSKADVVPDYAVSADVKSLTSAVETLSADIQQMRVELTAVEIKLSEPAPVITGSISKASPSKAKRK